MYAFNKRYRQSLIKGLTPMNWVFLLLGAAPILILVMKLSTGANLLVIILAPIFSVIGFALAYIEWSNRDKHRILGSLRVGSIDTNREDFYK